MMSPLVWFVLLSCLFSRLNGRPLCVYVDGKRGLPCTECLNHTPVVCRSLCDNLTQSSNVEILIVGDTLYLSKPVLFRNMANLKITSEEKNATIFCNESNSGVAFLWVRNLTIEFLKFENCGAERASTSVDTHTLNKTVDLNVAIYILNCTDVFIHNVAIIASNGTGLSLYDTNGNVTIANCIFSNNTAGHGHTDEGGGGVHIEFTICTPGTTGNCSGHNGLNQNSKYTINNSNFTRNMACTKQRNIFISPASNKPLPRLGKGGGLYVSVASNAAHNCFILDRCNFTGNSAGFGAGGMLSEFLDSVQNNTIVLRNVSFTENKCLQVNAANGGGLVFNAIFYAKSVLHGNNTFSCGYCTFVNNTAYFGGGTSICASKDPTNPLSLTKIEFHNCTWTANTAASGAALFVSPALWDFAREGFLPIPQLTDCFFISNSGIQPFHTLGKHIHVSSMGYGAVLSNEFQILFGKNVTFMQNKGSALYLSSSVLECQELCNVTFYNNTAKNGGAIVMHGTSGIRVWKKSNFTFIGNSAHSRGGAIYVELSAALQPIYRNCFVQSKEGDDKSEATFTFSGNTAGTNGSSIYSTTFRMCNILCPNTRPRKYSPKSALQCVANFIFNDTDSHPSLATAPDKFELNTMPPVKIIPGIEYHIPLLAYDESDTLLSEVVYSADIISSNSSVRVDRAFSQVSNNTILVEGNISESATLNLQVEDISLTLEILLTECQPGYAFSEFKCQYASSQYYGLVPCHSGVCLKQGYWMGVCGKHNKTLCTAFCPNGFCSYSQMNPHNNIHPLPNNSSELDQKLCGPHRTGTLCSECVNNRSVNFHSRNAICGPEKLCHLGFLFYFISEIIPLTAFFVIIVSFNVSFASGKISCFIFYAQVLDALSVNGRGAIRYPQSISTVHDIIMFIYHPFNLDFFTHNSLSFCLWKGSTIIDVLMMKYATVLFALFLVLFTILLAKWRYAWVKIFARFQTRRSILIHGLTAFFVLCYSQIVRVTFHLLTYFCLYSIKFKCAEKVLYPAGYLHYFEGDHIQYATIAIMVLIIFVITPPFLLLLYPLLFRVLGHFGASESKLAVLLWRIMPIQFLDAYQSSFKNKYRFFAGLYFLYRAAVLVMVVAARTLLQCYTLYQMFLITLLAIHAVIQPYKEKLNNVIDILLLTNLSIINAITLYNYTTVQLEEQYYPGVTINIMAGLQKFLMVLPLICLILAKFVKSLRKCKNTHNDYENLPSLRSQ